MLLLSLLLAACNLPGDAVQFIDSPDRALIHELLKLHQLARERLHILEGLAVALANIERVIALIRGSQTTDEARAKLTAEGFAPGFVGEMLARALGADAQRPTETGRGLIDGAYYLSDRQAQAILDMRLQRLTGLERDKIVDEYGELVAQIIDLLDILGSETRLLSEIRAARGCRHDIALDTHQLAALGALGEIAHRRDAARARPRRDRSMAMRRRCASRPTKVARAAGPRGSTRGRRASTRSPA